MTIGLYADRLELPRALLRREPYLVTTTLCEGLSGNGIHVETTPATGVTKRRPLDLGPLELLPPRLPGSFIASSILVMESDEGARRAGGLLENIAHRIRHSAVGQVIVGKGFGSLGSAGQALDQLAHLVARHLAKNGDEVMGQFQVRLEPEGDEWKPRAWAVENPRVKLHLRLAATAGAGDGFVIPKRWDDVSIDASVRVTHGGSKVLGEVTGRPGKTALVAVAGGEVLTFDKLADLELRVGEPDAGDDEDNSTGV